VKEEPKDAHGKVPMKKKNRLAEKGIERMKSKHHGTNDKTMEVGKEVTEEVEDEGDEEEQVEELEEVEEKGVAQAEKVVVKKGHSVGLKKNNTISVKMGDFVDFGNFCCF
jgi:hypothetical protein